MPLGGCFRFMAALHAYKYTCGQSPGAHVYIVARNMRHHPAGEFGQGRKKK